MDLALLRPPCVPLVYSVEHFPYAARRRWHIDVAQFETTVESVDDSVDDRRRGADGAGLTRALDAPNFMPRPLTPSDTPSSRSTRTAASSACACPSSPISDVCASLPPPAGNGTTSVIGRAG